MKRYSLIFLFIFASFISPSSASAAALTTPQVNAIIAVLQSFGVDQFTIQKVRAALVGSSPVVTSPANTNGNANAGIMICKEQPFLPVSSRTLGLRTGEAAALSFTAGVNGQVESIYSSDLYTAVSAKACDFNVAKRCRATSTVNPIIHTSSVGSPYYDRQPFPDRDRKCILESGKTYYYNTRFAKDAVPLTDLQNSDRDSLPGDLVETCPSGRECPFMPVLYQ
jgi:hypothetical protein